MRKISSSSVASSSLFGGLSRVCLFKWKALLKASCIILRGLLCLEEMFCHFSGVKGEIIDVTTNPTESQKLAVRN